MNFSCAQCEYDKMPENKRPKACNIIHQKKLNITCDSFKLVR
jgi:hypothetical protein